MMTVDEKAYIVIAKRDGKTVQSARCTGTHMLPTVMARLALRHAAVTMEYHQVGLRLVATGPAAEQKASGGEP